MEKLFEYQHILLKNVNDQFERFLMKRIHWEERMVGIKGPRGSGKTTLMLQYLKYHLKERDRALYFTVEHPWFLTHNLFYTVEEFYKIGGRYVFIDEVHKYPGWSRELKLIYDAFPDMRLVFSSSSALEIHKGEADLSRRVLMYELPGLSFREYLEFVYDIKMPAYALEEIFSSHTEIARKLSDIDKLLPKFKDYLHHGYYPATKHIAPALYLAYLYNVINAVLEQDLPAISGLSAATVFKLKRILGIIAESAPFEPNITAIASKTGTGRNTVLHFLHLLRNARLLNFLLRHKHGISALQKPYKIYLENTNLAYALKDKPNEGTLRETFVLNQVVNAGHEITYPGKCDFLIAGKYYIEVGGKNKNVKDKTVYVLKDNILTGFNKTIPLWLFGFLY